MKKIIQISILSLILGGLLWYPLNYISTYFISSNSMIISRGSCLNFLHLAFTLSFLSCPVLYYFEYINERINSQFRPILTSIGAGLLGWIGTIVYHKTTSITGSFLPAKMYHNLDLELAFVIGIAISSLVFLIIAFIHKKPD